MISHFEFPPPPMRRAVSCRLASMAALKPPPAWHAEPLTCPWNDACGGSLPHDRVEDAANTGEEPSDGGLVKTEPVFHSITKELSVSSTSSSSSTASVVSTGSTFSSSSEDKVDLVESIRRGISGGQTGCLSEAIVATHEACKQNYDLKKSAPADHPLIASTPRRRSPTSAASIVASRPWMPRSPVPVKSAHADNIRQRAEAASGRAAAMDCAWAELESERAVGELTAVVSPTKEKPGARRDDKPLMTRLHSSLHTKPASDLLSPAIRQSTDDSLFPSSCGARGGTLSCELGIERPGIGCGDPSRGAAAGSKGGRRNIFKKSFFGNTRSRSSSAKPQPFTTDLPARRRLPFDGKQSSFCGNPWVSHAAPLTHHCASPHHCLSNHHDADELTHHHGGDSSNDYDSEMRRSRSLPSPWRRPVRDDSINSSHLAAGSFPTATRRNAGLVDDCQSVTRTAADIRGARTTNEEHGAGKPLAALVLLRRLAPLVIPKGPSAALETLEFREIANGLEREGSSECLNGFGSPESDTCLDVIGKEGRETGGNSSHGPGEEKGACTPGSESVPTPRNAALELQLSSCCASPDSPDSVTDSTVTLTSITRLVSANCTTVNPASQTSPLGSSVSTSGSSKGTPRRVSFNPLVRIRTYRERYIPTCGPSAERCSCSTLVQV